MVQNDIKIYINGDDSLKEQADNFIAAFSNLISNILLVSPWNDQNQTYIRFKTSDSTSAKIPQRPMFLVGTEEVDDETWNIWSYSIPSSILNAVASDRAKPLYISFAQVEITQSDTPFIFKGLFPNESYLIRALPNPNDNEYAGIGERTTEAIVYEPDINGDWLRSITNQTIQDYELEHEIITTKLVRTSASAAVSVDPSIEGLEEEVDVTTTEIILDNLAILNGKVAANEIQINRKLNNDFINDYPISVEALSSDAIIIQKNNGGLFHINLSDLIGLISGNDKGIFDTEVELLNVFPNGIANPLDRAGWFCEVVDTDTIWRWDINDNAWQDSGTKGFATLEQLAAKSDKSDTGFYLDLVLALRDEVDGSAFNTNLAGAINLIYTIAQSGNGDMRKSEFATQELGKVDRAISDTDGNKIHETYATNTELDDKLLLKQNIIDETLNTVDNTVPGAINEVLNATQEADNKAVIAQNTANAATTLANTAQDTADSKTTGIIVKEKTVLVDNEVVEVNWGENLQITATAPGIITVDAVDIASSNVSIVNHIDPTGITVPLIEAKIDLENKTPSNDTGIIDNDVNNDAVVAMTGDIRLDFDTIIRNGNGSQIQNGNYIVYVNAVELDNLDWQVSEADGGDDTIVLYTPSQVYSATQILALTTYPITITINFITDNSECTLDKFQIQVTTGDALEVGNIMFTTTYDTNKNGKVDNADFSGVGTNYLTGEDNTQDALEKLDTELFDVAADVVGNTSNITGNASNITTLQTGKQEKIPGDLDTIAVSTSGAINENKANIDIVNDDVDTKLTRAEFDGFVRHSDTQTLVYKGDDENTMYGAPLDQSLVAGITGFTNPTIIQNIGDSVDYDDVITFGASHSDNASFSHIGSTGIKKETADVIETEYTAQVTFRVTGSTVGNPTTARFELLNDGIAIVGTAEEIVGISNDSIRTIELTYTTTTIDQNDVISVFGAINGGPAARNMEILATSTTFFQVKNLDADYRLGIPSVYLSNKNQAGDTMPTASRVIVLSNGTIDLVKDYEVLFEDNSDRDGVGETIDLDLAGFDLSDYRKLEVIVRDNFNPINITIRLDILQQGRISTAYRGGGSVAVDSADESWTAIVGVDKTNSIVSLLNVAPIANIINTVAIRYILGFK